MTQWTYTVYKNSNIVNGQTSTKSNPARLQQFGSIADSEAWPASGNNGSDLQESRNRHDRRPNSRIDRRQPFETSQLRLRLERALLRSVLRSGGVEIARRQRTHAGSRSEEETEASER